MNNQDLIYTALAFALIAISATVLCAVCKTDLSDLFPVYKPKRSKKLGGSFWGDHNLQPSTHVEESFAEFCKRMRSETP